MTSALKIGLAGCGRWGRNILRDLLSLGCAVDVADPDAAARAMAIERGAASVVGDVSEWRGGHDGYVVAAWTTQHAPVVLQLAQTGRPIFCEKPLTSDPAAADRIVSLAGDRVFVMHKWRYHPGVEAIAGFARSGEFGSVRQIVTRRLQWTTPHGDVDAVWSLTPHDLSMIYAILGYMPEPVAATGTSDPQGAARSIVGILGDGREAGAIVHVAANWPTVERLVSVVFEDAVAVLDDPVGDHVKLYPGRGGQAFAKAPDEERRITVSTEFPLLRELRIFLRHIEGGPAPMTDAAEGALVVRTLARLRALAGLSA